ncbi:MAG: DUF6597 domain-containing transcriptional factor, partial [Gemmatimonadota bacterium]
MLRYRELAPSGRLAAHVECLWMLEGPRWGGDESGPSPVLPDGRAELIVHLGDPFEHHPGAGEPRRQPRVLFAGQLSEPLDLRPTGSVAVLGVRFRPAGAAALLPFSQEEMAGRWGSLDELAPRFAREFVPRVLDAATPAEAALAADAVLARAVDDAADPAVAWAANSIVESGGSHRVADVARTLGLSERQFARRFRRQVGLGPKLLGRISRFQRVFEAFDRRPGGWATIAAQCGYYDGAHLIRDFRDFAGETPARLLAAADEFTSRLSRRRSMSDSSNTNRAPL